MTTVALFCWLALVALVSIATFAGLRLNTSPSVPRGVYLVDHARAEPGDYVAVCLPDTQATAEAWRRGYLDRGSCEGGYGELIKVLAARAGDRVRVTPGAVFVNDAPWPRSRPRRADGRGRRLDSAIGFDRLLTGEEVLLLSEQCAAGFDGRYFGPIPSSHLRGRARLWLRFDRGFAL